MNYKKLAEKYRKEGHLQAIGEKDEWFVKTVHGEIIRRHINLLEEINVEDIVLCKITHNNDKRKNWTDELVLRVKTKQ